MDGFGAAVNGYFDVEDQLVRNLHRRAREAFSTERDEKRRIDSREAFEERREHVRAEFRSSIGGLPDSSDHLSVETNGVLERDGYSVELVTFESLPNFHVTANCYVPEDDGPHPAVLFLCGHVPSPKEDPLNQRACIELAKNGFVVLIVDPVCQGERTQYDDPAGHTVHVDSGVFGHSYAGQKCYFAGANVARYMIHDARCAFDYLHARSDVDIDRIGVTGTSGGGMQTAYVSLLDDRIAAAAPCCYICEREEWLKTEKPHDAEQNLYGAISRGINYDDFVTAMAPRPVCIGAAASGFFPIEGVHEAHERARRIYELYDASENLHLTVSETTHASVYELRDGVLDWLCATLGDDEYVPVNGEIPTTDPTALHCTPDGSVRVTYENERSIDDLIREYVSQTTPDAGTKPTVSNPADYATQLGRRVVEKFDLDRTDCDLHPRYIARDESDGLTIEHVFFKTERKPDIVATGVLAADSNATTRSPAVVLYENGTDELPDKRADVVSLAEEYGTVFVFDPRGVGAVRNREIPTRYPPANPDYNGVHGTEFKLAYNALMLETSLFGMRVYDTLRAVEFVRTEVGGEDVSLVGEGIGAYHALYAAVADGDIETVDLRDLGPSFYEMATNEVFRFDSRLTAYDVIGTCDVPHLLAALDERDLRIERTGDRWEK